MSITFSKSQLTAMIWGGAGLHTYALIDGRQLPDLLPRLQGATDVMGWDKLARGHLSESEFSNTAFLVELQAGTEFSGWILDTVIDKIPDWGMLLISSHELIPLRDHCRDLLNIELPNGESREWRWYDTQLFQRLAPHWGSGQIEIIFTPFQSISIPGPDQWIWYFKRDHELVIEKRQVSGTAS